MYNNYFYGDSSLMVYNSHPITKLPLANCIHKFMYILVVYSFYKLLTMIFITDEKTCFTI